MDNDPIIWRCVSWKNSGGPGQFYHRQYLFDDLVSTDSLLRYIKELETRGIEDVKLERKGPMSFVMQNNLNPKPRPGAKRMSEEKKNHKLEEYQ